MNPLVLVTLIKEFAAPVRNLFGPSLRKEAIMVGVMPPVFLSAYTTIQIACVESCTIQEAVLSLSAQQWWGVVGSIVLMGLHLNAKRRDAKDD